MADMVLSNSTAVMAVPAKADYRHKCGRLLLRGLLMQGTVIEIRCPRCGGMHVIDTRPRGSTLVAVAVTATP